MEKEYHKLHKIELAEDGFKEKGLRIRVVKLWYNPQEYTCLTVEQLKTILRLWIKGEEEKYPLEKGFQGRWMLFDVIKKVFNEDLPDLMQTENKFTEEKQSTL